MIQPQQFHYCDTCDKQVTIDTDTDYLLKDEKLFFLNEVIILKDRKMAMCPTCGDEIYDEELDNQALDNAIKLWEQQTGKRYADQFPVK